MKKRFAATILTVLLLAGCGAGPEMAVLPSALPSATQPEPILPPSLAQPEEKFTEEDEPRHTFAVDTGGVLGTVLVTVERGGQEWDFDLSISVWDPADMNSPIQTMFVEKSNVFRWHLVIDANFDGYMDFGYMYAMGNQPQYYHFWLWDEASHQFVAEPLFDEISCPQFDPESKLISGYARSSCCSGIHSIYRWEDGALVCVRRVEVHYPAGQGEEEIQLLTVEDRVDGALTEVYRETFGPPEDGGEIYDTAARWYDLDYHGKRGDG